MLIWRIEMTNNSTLTLGSPVVQTTGEVKWPITFFILGQTLKEMPLFYRQHSEVVLGHLKEIRLNAILEGINEERLAMGLCFATGLEPGY